MRVVVSGGTGFIGRALVCSLAERGDDVVVLSRGGSVGSGALGARASCCRGAGKVELATWTPAQAGEWARVLDGADAVVHLAGAGIMDERWTPERKEVLRASRIRSTELVAEAVAKAAKRPRVLVSGSAIGVYGIRTGDRPLDEASPPGDDFLARLVVDWEAAAAPAREAGVRVAHPRVGLVLGREGGMLAKMLPAFRAFMGGPVGSGRQYLAWIHIVDAVRALELAIDDVALDGPFNVTAPEPVTMDAFARALGAALGRPSGLRVPPFAVRVAVGEGADAILTGPRAVPKRLVDRGFAFVFPDLASALSDLVQA